MRFAACSGLPRQQWQIKDKQVGCGQVGGNVSYKIISAPNTQKYSATRVLLPDCKTHDSVRISSGRISVPKKFNPGCSHFEQPLPDSALRGN